MTKSLRSSLRAVAATLVLAGGLMSVAIPASASAAAPCPNEQLREESLEDPIAKAPYSMQLPDCRAYELVSPSNTLDEPAIDLEARSRVLLRHEYDEELKEQLARPALVTAGGAVVYQSEAVSPLTGAVANGRGADVFVSRRGAAGWGTSDLTSHVNSDLENPAANFLLLAASTDGSRALIETPSSLTPEDQDAGSCGGADYYMLSVAQGPVLVSHGVLPRVATFATCTCQPDANLGGGLACLPPHGVATCLGRRQECTPLQGLTFNADLTTVGFRSSSPLDPGLSSADTNENTPGQGAPWAPCYTWSDSLGLATFADLDSISEDECEQLGMTPEGRPVFLEENEDPYEGRLFVGGGGEFPQSAVQVSGDTPFAASFAGVSSDGKTVFVATSDHLASPNADTGADIYAVHIPETPSGATPPSNVSCVSCGVNGGGASFVAQSADASHVLFKTPEGLWSWEARSGLATKLTSATSFSNVALSPNGRYAVLLTSEALSPQDNNGAPDVYELSAGAQPIRVTGGIDTDVYAAAAVSDSGQRVVYDDSPAGGGPQVVDEWSEGQTSQLSPRGDPFSSRLLGTVGEEFQDIFVLSNEPLVTQDLNSGTTSIYDARVDGGFPVASAPANHNQTPNPTDLASSPYPENLASPNVQPPVLAPDTSRAPSISKPKQKAKKKKTRKKTKKRSSTRRAGKVSSGHGKTAGKRAGGR
jgi:hypothetical protein